MHLQRLTHEPLKNELTNFKACETTQTFCLTTQCLFTQLHIALRTYPVFFLLCLAVQIQERLKSHTV